MSRGRADVQRTLSATQRGEGLTSPCPTAGEEGADQALQGNTSVLGTWLTDPRIELWNRWQSRGLQLRGRVTGGASAEGLESKPAPVAPVL